MSKTVRLIVIQGTNQLLDVLAVLRYQKASGEYPENCEDILLMGGYTENQQMTNVCLQISQIWDFANRIILHGYEKFCLDNNFDFDDAANLLKKIVNHQDVDVIYTLRNWHFINEIFFYTYPNARKTCYGELGRLDISATKFSSNYGVRPFNPSGQFIEVDDAYLFLVPINVENAFSKCQVKMFDAEFYRSVVYDGARQIKGLSEYCATIAEQNSITFALTSYETEAGFMRKVDDEIECYLSLILQHTQPEENILIKGHPRQRHNQSNILVKELYNAGRNATFVPDFFSRVLIELFVPFLSLNKVISPASSGCISLAYLSDCELIIGLGKNLASKYLYSRHPLHKRRPFGDYLRALTATKARKKDFETLQYNDIDQQFHQNSEQLITNFINNNKSGLIVNDSQRYVLLSGREIELQKQLENISVNQSQFTNQLCNFLEQYKGEDSEEYIITKLREARKEIVDFLLNIPDELLEDVYLSNFATAYKILRKSNFIDISNTESEKIFVDELSAEITTEWEGIKGIKCILAIMLYRYSHELPLPYNITHIPEWFLTDYLKFILKIPKCFLEIGDVEKYYQYLQNWISYIHRNVTSNSGAKRWQKVATIFTKSVVFIPLYFQSITLKELCQKRAEIIEVYLKNCRGQEIDYEFSMGGSKQSKIRVGILAWYFTPKSETFATLPIYKYLNRDKFQIILFSLETINHRIERYCAGHADGMIQLPDNLSEQVEKIRQAELDILFISTNVTAATNPVTLLALHRLARIQIVDANSPVTTGMRHIDYYISSKLSEPKNNAEQHYTETLIKLDSPPQCFDFGTEEKILPTIKINRENFGIDENSVVYISGANYYKIIPEVEATWAKIIANVPNSILVLYPFNPNWSPSYPVNIFRRRITSTFAKHNIREERLIILEAAPNRADVQERLKIADIYLDSYPYSGMTSLIDPLQVGLPIVALEGEYSRSQKGASLLRELQITDLITNNEEDYIQLAINLGKNREFREEKCVQIQQKMGSKHRFIDSRTFSEEISHLFQRLFQNHLLDTLRKSLRLRDINLIIFPDWNQSEDLLYQDLANVIRASGNHPDKSQMTLLIDINNIDEEDADMAISSVVMNLMMEEELEVDEGPEIVLVTELSQIQWSTLMPHLQGRIKLDNENEEVITQLKVENIPVIELDRLLEKIHSSQTKE
ncbi:MAG: hypothetical protein F6K40_10645 [Okeania sp. SIO3I5]|uniref:O-linked N-acetylglucosamine transferase, SPINDLY family protein n=1 Tax=Okeania sp. SIO3I5 TaxID=2607805 RepID=UPI0013BE80FE|nr:hypothetical protein [Okeania sp. SIO3I5]NEQ36711.1 hypothetical protein [Okeania sp. SIO3I5]